MINPRFLLFGVVLAGLWPASAAATYPGGNGALLVLERSAADTVTESMTRAFRVNPDGSGRQLVARSPFDMSASWSADGRRIVICTARRMLIKSVAVDRSREVTELNGIVDCELSPNGKRLVFTRITRDTSYDIFTMKA